MATVGLTEAEREAIERLENEVIHPSMTALVILDFWSDRSPASKQLSLALEKVVAEYAAKGVVLVKIDVDKDKVTAAQFRIQAIPTVYAIHRGQPVADLTEFRTEAQLKRALDQLLGQLKIGGEATVAEAEIEPLVAMAEQVLTDGDAPRAVSIFRQIRDMAPDDPAVIGGLLRALVEAGELDEARQILGALPPDLAKKPEISRAGAALEIASAPAVDTDALEARLSSNPDDHEARFELAAAKSARATATLPPRLCSRSSGATANGTRAPPGPGSFSCWRHRAWAIRGRARSGAGFRPCCSHEPKASDPDLPAGRGDPVPARAVAAPHLRAALPRDGPGRDRGRRADRDHPAPSISTTTIRPCTRSAASATSWGSRSSTTAASISCCSEPTASA